MDMIMPITIRRFRYAIFTIACLTMLAAYSNHAHAFVTYNGTEGVHDQIFAPVCTNCHTSSYPDNDANRQGAANGVNFDTYLLAISLPSYITNDTVTYPPATYKLPEYSNGTRAAERAATAPQPNSASMPPTYLYVDYPGTTTPYTLLSTNHQTLLSTWAVDGLQEHAAPTVTTIAASAITKTTATLNSGIAQNGETTSTRFRYDSSLPLNSGTLTTNTAIGSGGGVTDYSHSAAISGLSCGTTYYFHAQATNLVNTTVGSNLSFNTLPCSAPVITLGTSTTVLMSVDSSPDAFSLTLNATDADNSTLTWSISSGASNGTATASGNGSSKTIGYTPTAGYFGTDAFEVTVTDDTPGTPLTDTIIVNVNIGLEPPIITEGAGPYAVNIDEDNTPTAFALTLNATDADSTLSTLSWSVTSPANNGIAIATGTGASRAITYTPNSNYFGTDSFIVTVADPQNNVDAITINLTINPDNIDAPVISSTAGLYAEETHTYTYQVTATDPDNNSEVLDYQLSNAPTGMAISSSGLITWTPNIGITTSGAVTITVTDTTSRSDTEIFTISVSPPDADIDTVADYNDNCVNVANTDQSDIDTDSIGDVCDGDPDGNGLLNTYLEYTVTQSGRTGSIIFQDASVRVTANLAVAGSGSETYDWSATDSTILAAQTSLSGNTLDFDPASLALGVYNIDVTVTDAGSTTHNTLLLNLLAASVPLLTATDTDGDTLPDNDSAEGYADDDNDGVPNLRDDTADTTLLPTQSGDFDTLRYLQSEAGTKISLGTTATAAGHFGAIISDADLTAYGGVNGTATTLNTNTGYTIISDYFDFTITGLTVGGTVHVVLPLSTNIQNGAIYSKFTPTTGWQNFVVDTNNTIASAISLGGICPSPGSSDYINGLIIYNNCIQLTLQDGGPNDADNEQNGVVHDPGVVTIPTASASSSTTCTATLFNNCPEQGGSIGAIQPLFLFMLLPALTAYRLRRKIK
jgi:hypothetical protein